MLINRYYHGEDGDRHLDRVEILPELSCEMDFHPKAEIDHADIYMYTQAPKMFNYLTKLK